MAGANQTDVAATKANEWLSQKGLPVLQPVDSIAQWGFILNGTNGRPSDLHVSENALLRWPYKVVTGRQIYSRWQGELYPNCSTINGSEHRQGPVPTDVKVYNVPLSMSPDHHALDVMQWAEYCDTGCLFNVETDPTEHSNLANDPAHAGKLKSMLQALDALNNHSFSPDRGNGTLAACLSSVDNGGYYGPFADVEHWYTPMPAPSIVERLKRAAAKKEMQVANTRTFEDFVRKQFQNYIWRRTSGNRTSQFDKCLPTDQEAAEFAAEPQLDRTLELQGEAASFLAFTSFLQGEAGREAYRGGTAAEFSILETEVVV